jgi:putative acetyltransferase
MMHAMLSAADALEVPLVGLLGSPEYYSRFGFVLAETLGIESPPQSCVTTSRSGLLPDTTPR